MAGEKKKKSDWNCVELDAKSLVTREYGLSNILTQLQLMTFAPSISF